MVYYLLVRIKLLIRSWSMCIEQLSLASEQFSFLRDVILAHLDEHFLQFSGLGFASLGPFHCIDFCVFMFVFFLVLSCHTAYVLYYCNTVGWTWWDGSLILEHLPSVLWHCWLGHLIRKKTVPDMTYSVFGGTLNLTQPYYFRLDTFLLHYWLH